MSKYLFFDNASTTRCCDEASRIMQLFTCESYGNPSSAHALGQTSARAIRDARHFFAEHFHVNPNQIIFTGSGSESDNLAVYGIAMNALAENNRKKSTDSPRILCSAIEHPAVKKTVQSLASLGFDVQLIPVDSQGQIDRKKYMELLTPSTILVSVQRVNNIMGAVLPVEELAEIAKKKVPGVVFHTDAVQAFGRVDVPIAPSQVDLVSVSAHKIEGPKGVGALIVLNSTLLKSGMRPLVWGGEQEGGFRSGTQNPGLIAGFHLAAEHTLKKQEEYFEHTKRLQKRFKDLLKQRKLLTEDGKGPIQWNSPKDAVPHIVNLSVPGYPSGALAKLLEERLCLVSTGSACSSQKMDPDAVLAAMGLPVPLQTSAIRISFSSSNQESDIDTLAHAFDESIQLMSKLLGGNKK